MALECRLQTLETSRGRREGVEAHLVGRRPQAHRRRSAEAVNHGQGQQPDGRDQTRTSSCHLPNTATRFNSRALIAVLPTATSSEIASAGDISTEL
jgi:hypothetical protein